MISSGVAGPLGVLHLPRLWQKLSLGSVGKLDDAYPCCGKGFDQMVLDALQINREEFLAFVASKKPTYPQTEEWITQRCGGSVDKAAVARLNASISSYLHTNSLRQEIIESLEITSESPVLDAITLNNLDDWQTFWNKHLR